ncbi:MAG: GTP cyclohydrolase I [Kiritimatiellia bacterium]|jgi:GTP cyclohydrolase I
MNDLPIERQGLPDHAAESDDRDVAIDQVGIRGLRWPIRVMDRAHRSQATIAVVDATVGLPAEQKGTHMSRFVEILHGRGHEITLRTIPDLLAEIQRRLESRHAYLTVRFPYFMSKRAPVSGAESLMDYDCVFHAGRKDDVVEFCLEVKVPVTSLCPCSKAISDYGAHNQRSTVTVRVESDEMVWIEQVVEAVERCGSAPLYALLKREDEKFVTEQAFDNPRFVEDLVRDTSLALREITGVRRLVVEADNQESIHNHSAWARLVWDRNDGQTACAPEPAGGFEAQEFGHWLRARRTELKLSQRDLATQLGTSASWISKVESGDKQLSSTSLTRLAQILGVDALTVLLRAGVVPEDLMSRIGADPEGFVRWATT